MKKTGIFILCIILLASLSAVADTNCTQNENICPQTRETNTCDKFLCTNNTIENIFKETGLSDSQICSAKKLQEQYELETLSLNERILSEENVLNEYIANCAGNSDKRSQQKKINNLRKSRNNICKCYEKQFKVMLSNAQRKAYNKYRK